MKRLEIFVTVALAFQAIRVGLLFDTQLFTFCNSTNDKGDFSSSIRKEHEC